MPEHRRLRFDATDAPAEHAEPADHRRVAVGAEQRIRARQGHPARLFQKHHRRKPLEIELMHDAAAGRDQTDVREGSGTPFEEFEPFSIARDLDLFVEGSRVRPAAVHRNQGVIAHEIDRNLRIGFGRIAAAPCDLVAQRGHVGHQRDAGEILQQQARRLKFQAAAPGTFGETGEIECSGILRVAQRAFDEDLQGQRKSARGNQALRLGTFEAHVFDPAVSSGKGREQGFRRRSHGHSITRPGLGGRRSSCS